jgi:hypothetical protein
LSEKRKVKVMWDQGIFLLEKNLGKKMW